MAEGILDAENPKADAAHKNDKAPLDLLERGALEDTARAMHSGAVKYGKKNYRVVQMKRSTYAAAMLRHALAFADGEDIDPESGLPHIALLSANVHVLYGAAAAGTLTEDRGPSEPTTLSAEVHGITGLASLDEEPLR